MNLTQMAKECPNLKRAANIKNSILSSASYIHNTTDWLSYDAVLLIVDGTETFEQITQIRDNIQNLYNEIIESSDVEDVVEKIKEKNFKINGNIKEFATIAIQSAYDKCMQIKELENDEKYPGDDKR
jgi:hypothetical protein